MGSTDEQDAMLGLDGKMLPETGEKPPDPDKPEEAPATARMFYVAYFKKNPGAVRPVTFFYNGGPGSLDDVAAYGVVWAEAGGDDGWAA